MSERFLSCDWGTSNFRLRLISAPDLKIIAEHSSDKGVSDTYKAWQASGASDQEKRKEFYINVIKEAILKLESDHEASLDGVPVIISGMASSTIGMIELPYQELPFSIDGKGLKIQSFDESASFRHRLILISGVKSEDDVMRGEETQLVGSITQEMRNFRGTQLFIHPGTHSKHILIKDGVVISFKTYMTGEFFKLFTTHGILRDNVEKVNDGNDSMQHFDDGVQDSINTNLLHAAFKVRTNDLFKKMTKGENSAYLSGLLIGTELQELNDTDCKIYLAAGETLINHYQTALKTLGLANKVTVLPAKEMDESVIRGQYQIYKNLQSHEN